MYGYPQKEKDDEELLPLQSCSMLQLKLREIQDKWWNDTAETIQSCPDWELRPVLPNLESSVWTILPDAEPTLKLGWHDPSIR